MMDPCEQRDAEKTTPPASAPAISESGCPMCATVEIVVVMAAAAGKPRARRSGKKSRPR